MNATNPALFLGPLLLALASGAHGADKPAQADAPKLSPAQAQQLAKLLDGKEAGTPVTCISARDGGDFKPIGDRILVYKRGKNLVYRNELIGSCAGLRFGDTLVVQIQGSEYCRGDIARAVNLTSGTLTGSCALGDFVPYRTPGTGKPGSK
jgi:hypothetical protein